MKARILAVFAGALAISCLNLTTVQAALIAQQSYDGTTFGFNNPLDTGTVQAGLTYLTLTTSGGSRNFGNSPQTSFAVPGNALPQTGTYYMSWLMDTTGNLNFGANLTLFTSFFHTGNGPGGGTEIGGFGQNNGFINFFKGNFGPQPPNNWTDIPTAIPTTAGTHLFVLGITTDQLSNTSSFSLYYDPISSVAPAPVFTYSTGLPPFRLEIFRPTGQATWDEFRVGESFADVTPGLPVPEPGVAALAGIGLLLILRRARSPHNERREIFTSFSAASRQLPTHGASPCIPLSQLDKYRFLHFIRR